MKYLIFQDRETARNVNHRAARLNGCTGCKDCEPRCLDCTGDTQNTVYWYMTILHPTDGRAALAIHDGHEVATIVGWNPPDENAEPGPDGIIRGTPITETRIEYPGLTSEQVAALVDALSSDWEVANSPSDTTSGTGLQCVSYCVPPAAP